MGTAFVVEFSNHQTLDINEFMDLTATQINQIKSIAKDSTKKELEELKEGIDIVEISEIQKEEF